METKKEVGFAVKTLSNLIKRHLDNSSGKKNLDNLTGTHGWVIGYLCHNLDHDVFQRDLEETFSIRRSTATTILQLMEKNGLITREPVPYDARLKKLVLTEKAMELHEMFRQDIRELETTLVQGISEEEVDTVLMILEKMKKNLE